MIMAISGRGKGKKLLMTPPPHYIKFFLITVCLPTETRFTASLSANLRVIQKLLAHLNRQVFPSNCHHNFNRWQVAITVVFNGGSHSVLQGGEAKQAALQSCCYAQFTVKS